MMLKKKILSGILASAVALTAGMMPQALNLNGIVETETTAEAVKYSNTDKYGDLLYRKVDENDDGKYDYIELTGCDESVVSVEVPEKIEGLPVTSLGGVFSDCDLLESIKIPDSVTNVTESMFHNKPIIDNQPGPLYYIDKWLVDCYQYAESVEIKEGTVHIANEAFQYAQNLKSLKIPEGVKDIGQWGIAGCISLETIELPDSLTSIGYQAFSECSSLKSIEIGDNVTDIGEALFHHCSALKTVKLPKNITELGDSVSFGLGYGFFEECTSLESVEIPDKVTRIGRRTFYNCASLKSVDLPESVKIIDNSAFYHCSKLDRVVIRNPRCEIDNSDATICSGKDGSGEYFLGTICGYTGSTAQEYAEKWGYKFESLGPAPGVRGDADGDGKTSARDCSYIARMCAQGKMSQLPLTADFNGDGKVNVRDAAAIANYLAKGGK